MPRPPRNETELAKARRDARVDLLSTDLHRDETAAFDVVVDGLGLVGRWSQEGGRGGSVTWTTGETFDTGSCDVDLDKIAAAIRESIPFRIEEPRGPRRFLRQILPGGDGGG